MLSRVADSIYWMSRQIERAENVARFVGVNLHMRLDLPPGVTEQWMPLVITTGDDASFGERYGEATRENVTQFLTFDTDNPNSILSCLRAARENARGVREIISSEMWEQLNKFYLMVRDTAGSARARELPEAFFADVRMASHLFVGVSDATMSHGEGWNFAQLGRMIERADKTTRILDMKYFILLPSLTDVGTPFDDLQWSAVLRAASALEMYRKRYGRLTWEHVVDFLLLDRDFPRAVHHCVIHAQEALHAITGTPFGTFKSIADRRMGQLRSDLDFAMVEDVIAKGLHEYLDSIQVRLNDIADGIFETFFAMRPAPLLTAA